MQNNFFLLFQQFILQAAEEAAHSIKAHNATIAINCLSGRGRTGTFASLVVGKFKPINSLDKLTDVIVEFRQGRDSMVETPAQFKYIARLLNLGDTSKCDVACKVSKFSSRMDYSPGFSVGVLVGAFLALAATWLFQFKKLNRRKIE